MKNIGYILATSLFFTQAVTAQVTIGSSGNYYNVYDKPVFLLGHYSWASIDSASRIDHPSTYIQMLNDAEVHKLNYLRISLSGLRFTKTTNPKIHDSAGNNHPTPSFVKYIDDKADLEQWNEPYWTALSELAALAEQKGVILHVALFDGVTLRGGNKAYRWVNSVWNKNNQVETFFNIDKNGVGGVDTMGEFYDVAGFVESDRYGNDNSKLGYYQKKFIDKAISVLEDYDNVIFETGNELFGSLISWNEAVIKYIQKKYTDKGSNVLVTINNHKGIGQSGFFENEYINGYAVHSFTQSTQNYNQLSKDEFSNVYASAVKTELNVLSNSNFPVWIDPDEPNLMKHSLENSNRKAAWISLVSGAAGWGGFTDSYWNLESQNEGNEGVEAVLEDYNRLLSFISARDLPLNDMLPNASLISGSSKNGVLVKENEVYLGYIPQGDSSITLSLGSEIFKCYTFDPNLNDSFKEVDSSCSGTVSIDKPNNADDWVVYAVRTSTPPEDECGESDPEPVTWLTCDEAIEASQESWFPNPGAPYSDNVQLKLDWCTDQIPPEGGCGTQSDPVPWLSCEEATSASQESWFPNPGAPYSDNVQLKLDWCGDVCDKPGPLPGPEPVTWLSCEEAIAASQESWYPNPGGSYSDNVELKLEWCIAQDPSDSQCD